MQNLPEIKFEKTTRSSKNPNLVAFQSNTDHVPTKAELDIQRATTIARAVKEYNSSKKSLAVLATKYGVSKSSIDRYI